MGALIFILLLADNGGQLYFDLAQAPNFVSKLRSAGIDASSFPRMPRLSALP